MPLGQLRPEAVAAEDDGNSSLWETVGPTKETHRTKFCAKLVLLRDKALRAGVHIVCQNPCSSVTVKSPHLLSGARPECGKRPQATDRLWEK